MASDEHLKILRQGVEGWNAWREEHPEVEADLREADLCDAILVGANLKRAILLDASLNRARLVFASLQSSRLAGASLNGAVLDNARLDDARLVDASFIGANFKNAFLDRARLDKARLDNARLYNTRLRSASLASTSLVGASLKGTILSETVFANVNFSKVQSLEQAFHMGPSIVDNRTLARFEGNAPEAFLRGCGLSDWEIEAAKLHNPNLTHQQITDILYEIDHIRADSPILVNPLFIAYSHANTPFVEALERRFDKKRIRYWRDAHDLKAGRMETQIDRAIRHNPIVLLVLSEASVESDWMEWEVSKARELERQYRKDGAPRDVLCPIALDDSWKDCDWEGPLRRQLEKYAILDFSEWQDDAAMERQFQKLIDGLEMFYPSVG